MPFIDSGVNQPRVKVPYFEDASSELGITGHRTRKKIHELKNEVSAAMARLGGGVVAFREGEYSERRYWIRIEFTLGGARGRIDLATLPFRSGTTPTKHEDAVKQCLYVFRDKLVAEYNAMLMMPGSVPLVGYLIGAGDKTVTEFMVEQGDLPLLTGGNHS